MFCLEYRLGWDSLDNAWDLETAPESYIYLVYNTPGILPIPQTQATISLTFPPCIPDSNPYRITSTKCRINTVVSPDDGHKVARNIWRKGINIPRKIVHKLGFIYKIPLIFLTVLFPHKANHHTGHQFKSQTSKYPRDYVLLLQHDIRALFRNITQCIIVLS
jgi:hypothetical protein